MAEDRKDGRMVRIGGASGYWGDSQEAPRQLLTKGNVNYLVLDYLAEVTMSVLVRAKQKSPENGYARDFIDLVMKPLLHEIKARGVRVIANAGGVNVEACAAALALVAKDAGIPLRIGTVTGDDLSGKLDGLRAAGITEMFTGAPMPRHMISANAYLGAFPIAAALDEGAEVVITGRCVDSALVLGPLIHEFGWTADDFDLLAAGSLAGHIIECGAQATGGNFTDWRDVVDGWDDMGYPIAECYADGRVVITKPPETGGLVSRLTVGEQLLYEIGDPAAYILPDVICDFSQVELHEIGTHRVELANVRGSAPAANYKVSATYLDGYRATTALVVTGFEAVPKARAFADALLRRTRRLLSERDLGDYVAFRSHVIGAETLWGANARTEAEHAREVVIQIDVRHRSKDALELFSKETTGVGLSMTTGRTRVGTAGRPKVSPVVAQYAFFVAKSDVPVTVVVDGRQVSAPMPARLVGDVPASTDVPGAPVPLHADMVEVPLIELAVARSGDKGDSANIGVMARAPTYLPWIENAVTADRVREWFAHTVEGEVTRYRLPRILSLNFVLTRSLGGGGTSSLHLDTQAKTYAQQLLAMPVPIPASLLAERESTRS